MLMELLPLALMTVLALLIIHALIDCARTPAARIRHVPRALWLLFMLCAPVLGSLAWTYWGKDEDGSRAGRASAPVARAKAANI